MRKETGFTLIELMIVVAIVGIVAAIVLPLFIGGATLEPAVECVPTLPNG